MRVPTRGASLSAIAAACATLLVAAYADQTTSPRHLSPTDADLAVVNVFPVEAGALQQTINSGSGITYCGYNSTQAPVAGTVYDLAGNCVASQDLNTALQTYNPGWSSGFNANAAHWIGPTTHLDPAFPGALSNQYVADVGSYQFVTTFNVANNATNRALELEIMSDNAVVVYLNGTEIGRNAALQDCPVQQTNCNWTTAGSLKITGTPVVGTNTLRVDLVGTAIGLIVNGQTPRSNCTNGPQFFGEAGFSGVFNVPTPQHLAPNANWVVATCKNPTGVNLTARVYFTPPVVIPVPLFVIGDVEPHAIGDVVNFWGAQWWKNNVMSQTTNPPQPSDPGFQAFKGFASSADNFCGGVWSTQPGNSSNPPETIPDDVAIIVTTKVNKDGNAISGDIKQIVLVHHDGNYKDNPGHAGGGPVIKVLCTLP